MPPYGYDPPYIRRGGASAQNNSQNPPELTTWKHELAKSVKDIEAYGNFATSKTYTTFSNPGLEVADVKIPLPLPDLYAEQIKAVARSAPFGRGDETVVDHSVRLTWELNHDEFRITNPSWQAFLDRLTQDAAAGLGLKPDEIRIEPYKLLLYERGSFFKPHKDSEKTSGMIGSMIVCLPSPHEGGDVHLSHAGSKSVFATAPSSAFDLKVLAWYSDVTHEVKEVTSGHRLALTFNMIQTSASGKSGSFFVQQQLQLRGLMERWQQRFSNLERLVIFTDHKYTPQSLSANNMMKTLKGRDRAVLESLRSVCADIGIYIFLANVEKKSSDLYGDDLDSEEDDDIGIWMELLCDLKGKELARDVAMDETDILGPIHTKGDTLTRRRRASSQAMRAIVLIPWDKLYTILDHINTVALTSLVMENYMKDHKDLALRAHASDFMSKALSLGNAVGIRSIVLTMAWTTNNDELYRNAIRSYTASGEVPDDLVEKLASLLKKTRSATRASECQRRLVSKLQESSNKALVGQAIEMLVDRDRANVMPGAENIAKEILGSQLPSLCLGKVDWLKGHLLNKDSVVESDRFLRLIEVCLECDWVQETTELLRLSYEHLKQRDSETPQLEAHVINHMTSIGNIGPSFVCQLAELSQNPLAPFIEPQRKLIEHIIRNYIVGKPPVPPPQPEGWTFKPGGCKPLRAWGGAPCDICQPLDEFLVDPDRQTGEFCDTVNRRRHIEKQLPRHLFLCTTDPHGRGGRHCQTLVVTKRMKGGDHVAIMELYNGDIQRLRKKVEHLRTDSFRNILGDDLYRELILMDRLPGSQAARTAGSIPQAVAGIKREAEDDGMLPPATRRYYNGHG
ncbi:hypothetical protein N0V82_001111 [Gnomoniopsis sp. IMI 355080]|nr:hypothetical protein N0V82_001111 [Gnomoniopsis sp. IMI 355080]